MLKGHQLSLCSSVNQHQPMASDWAEHFGFSHLIMGVLNAVCCGLGQNKPEDAIKAVSPRENGLEWPVTQQGHTEQGHYLKSHLEN